MSEHVDDYVTACTIFYRAIRSLAVEIVQDYLVLGTREQPLLILLHALAYSRERLLMPAQLEDREREAA